VLFMLTSFELLAAGTRSIDEVSALVRRLAHLVLGFQSGAAGGGSGSLST